MNVYDFPTGIDIQNISVTAKNAVGVSKSSFTFKEQVFQYEGQTRSMLKV